MNLSIEKTMGKNTPIEAAPVRKFMFDLSFDETAVVNRAPERKPVLMKPDQIDDMKKESYNAGFAAGKKEGLDEQTAALALIVSKVGQNVATLMQNIDALAKEQDEQMRHLVLAVAKKILPAFTAQNGIQEIEALANDTIREMAREPRLVVRVQESQFDALNEKIQEIATQRAYPGKIVVISDADIASGDCRIEWADGGIARETQNTWKSIEQTILPSS